MHLYTFSIAPNPQRLDYFLKVKEITDIPSSQIDIRAGEHFFDEFKSINPASTLPTLLCDNGTVLTDTIAICVYLESQYPNKPLFGENSMEYAQVIGWMHKLYVNGLMPIADMLRNQGDMFKDRALPGKVNIPQIADLVVRGKLRLDDFWSEMNEYLTDKEFIVGKQLTMADIDCYVVCGFATWVKAQIPESCTALSQWHKRISKLLES